MSNNNSCTNSTCSSVASARGAGDAETNYDSAMNGINTTMPTPGNGTNCAGDTPQEVLFFVTDGVEDENNPSRIIQQINGGLLDQLLLRRSRRAASRSRYSTPNICRLPSTHITTNMSNRFNPTSARRCKPARRPACTTMRRSTATSAPRLSTLFQAVVQSATLTH